MKKNIKEKWLAALRSGDYQQTDSALRTTKGFCCLGVLCDLYDKTKRQNNWEFLGDVKYRHLDNMYGSLPDAVMQWAGLDSEDPLIVRSRSHSVCLSELNDQENYSFKKIANVIEKYL
jgi:hypothetical protein